MCLPARNGADTANIPDLKLCTAYCDPTDTNACGSGATCVSIPGIAELDCIWTPNQAAGTACMGYNSCAPGLACASGTCKHWCPDAGTLNGAGYCVGNFWGTTCTGWVDQVFLNGTEYGVCN